MKLVRYGEAGNEKPGMIDANGGIRDLSSHVSDINGETLTNLDKIKGIDEASLPLVDGSTITGAN